MFEFLRLCGFSETDIQKHLPRAERAFVKMGIDASDIQKGKDRLEQYYDIKLEGLRKALRLCLLEVLDSVLAREEAAHRVSAHQVLSHGQGETPANRVQPRPGG